MGVATIYREGSTANLSFIFRMYLYKVSHRLIIATHDEYVNQHAGQIYYNRYWPEFSFSKNSSSESFI